MTEEPVERRLAAILAADVVGYSRLMGIDEVGTLRRLRAYRSELIDPAIAARRGRIVKTTGDGLLVEFASAVDAVACAITAQRALAARNEGEAEDGRLVFRIGINVGDIIIEADDIFGDGVNVAARLETLSRTGRAMHLAGGARSGPRQATGQFDDLGEQVGEEHRASGPRVRPEPGRHRRRAGFGGRRGRPRRDGGARTAGPGSLLRWGGGARRRRRRLVVDARTVLATAGARTRAVSAPEAGARASIAVLPLPARRATRGDYFADGLTEDIIAALGRFRELSVIAPAAVFAYKGKNPTPAEVGRDLKVSYVVEGSVRRAAENIRVSVNLTDTAHSQVLWSEKYDAEPKDIFSVQDQITRRISGALAVRVTNLEIARSAAKRPGSMEAYDLVLRGAPCGAHLTRADNAQARALFERAIELDPKYAPAYIGLGRIEIRRRHRRLDGKPERGPGARREPGAQGDRARRSRSRRACAARRGGTLFRRIRSGARRGETRHRTQRQRRAQLRHL